MTWKKALAIGCGGCLVLCAVAAALLVAGLIHLGQEPEGVEVSVSTPIDVVVGETFTLEVTVANQRSSKRFGLTDIDIAEEYLEGFSILRTTPDHVSSIHLPIDNTRSFTFNTPVAAGESAVFSFELRAEREGYFKGDVDVCEGARFLSKLLQTAVRPSDDGRLKPEAG